MVTERERNFTHIKEYFDKKDIEYIQKKGTSVFHTSHGLYGSSGLLDVYRLFEKIDLESYDHFVDLGSGDGRVAILASLFTRATGIEADEEMAQHAHEAFNALKQTVPLSDCILVQGDFTAQDLSAYDCIFSYADHAWPEELQKKLQHECTGLLISHQNIYAPTLLKKGKTIWIAQIPFVTYAL